MASDEPGVRSYLGGVAAALSLALVIAMALSFVLGFVIVFLASKPGQLEIPFPLYVFVFALPVLLGQPFDYRTIFVAASSLYLIAYAWAALGPNSLRGLLHRSTATGPRAIYGNALTSVASTFALLVLAIAAISALQEAVGVKTGSLPQGDPAQDFVFISFGPLAEEIGFRLSIIGFPALLLALSRGLGLSSLRCLWRPGFCAGQRSHATIIYSATLLSSLAFGGAHLLYGAGYWDIGKISTATIAGLAIGILYVTYGFPAAVLAHWGFNYGATSYYYSERLLKARGLTDAFDILVIAVGLASAVALVDAIRERLTSKPPMQLNDVSPEVS